MFTEKFIPNSNEIKVIWLHNFATKLHFYKDKYNLTTEEIADMLASDLYWDYVVTFHKKVDEYKINLTAYRNELADGTQQFGVTDPLPKLFDEEEEEEEEEEETEAPPAVPNGIFVRASLLAQRIKKSTNFAIADGQNLGIIGEQSEVDLNAMKPEFTIRLVQGGHPELVWKKERMDGVEIYVKRPGMEEFAFLDYNQYPNYIDMHTLPAIGRAEIWSYMMIYRVKDIRIGSWSDVKTVTVTGVLI